MDPPGPSERHLSVGNINLDILMTIGKPPGLEESIRAEDQWIGLGGAAANYAVALSRLGASCSLVAATGQQAEVLGLLQALRDAGVDTGRVKVLAGHGPGVAVILSIPSMSSRIIVKSPGANSLLSPSMLPPGPWAHVHIASTSVRIVETASRLYHAISYDPGGVALSDPEGVASTIRLVDYLMVNSRELEAITGTPDPRRAATLVRGRVRAVVVKQGVEGAYAVTRDRILRVGPPPVDRVLDTTGAGDAFNAAFNLWISRGSGLGEALKAGVAAGAAKVARVGSSNMPSRGEVEALLRRTPEPTVTRL